MSHCDSSECIGSGICFGFAIEAQCTSLVVECLDLITVCAFSVDFGVLIFVGWFFGLVLLHLHLLCLYFVSCLSRSSCILPIGPSFLVALLSCILLTYVDPCTLNIVVLFGTWWSHLLWVVGFVFVLRCVGFVMRPCQVSLMLAQVCFQDA